MWLRSFAVTLVLAVGLLVILGLAFVMCIPADLLNFMRLLRPQTRALTPTPPIGRLSRT